MKLIDSEQYLVYTETRPQHSTDNANCQYRHRKSIQKHDRPLNLKTAAWPKGLQLFFSVFICFKRKLWYLSCLFGPKNVFKIAFPIVSVKATLLFEVATTFLPKSPLNLSIRLIESVVFSDKYGTQSNEINLISCSDIDTFSSLLHTDPLLYL